MAVARRWPLRGAFNKSKVFGPVHDQGEKYRGSTVDMEGQGIVTFGRLVQGEGGGMGERIQMQGYMW